MSINFRGYILLVFLCGCMAKPKQPPLTKQEDSYFKQLSQECTCKVTREIDPRPESERLIPNSKRSYSITFDSLAEQKLKNIDSLKAASKLIAKKLRKEILLENYSYPYDSILVFYYSPIDKINVKFESFIFGINELNK